MSWQDALLIHRAAENHRGVALMVHNSVPMRLIAVWAKYKLVPR